MSLKICSLFSGSSGNCTYVAGGGTEIIIDAGVAATKIAKSLNKAGADVNKINVLVTHRHSDHISGIAGLTKKYGGITVYAHISTVSELAALGVDLTRIKIFGDSDFYIGNVTVSPFALSHDVPCFGFELFCGGSKITYVTDTGILPPNVILSAKDSNLVFIECNHSPELLMANQNYSYPLKRRISGEKGHLSNEACAQAVTELAKAGVTRFILAHLSKENNYPELAYSVIRAALDQAGDYSNIRIEVAPADSPCPVITV